MLFLDLRQFIRCLHAIQYTVSSIKNSSYIITKNWLQLPHCKSENQKKVKRCSLRHHRPLGMNCHQDKQRLRIARFNLRILIKWHFYTIFFALHWKYSIMSSNSKAAVQAARLDQKGHKLCAHLQTGAFPNGGNNLAATGVTPCKLIRTFHVSSFFEKGEIHFPFGRGTLAEPSAHVPVRNNDPLSMPTSCHRSGKSQLEHEVTWPG